MQIKNTDLGELFPLALGTVSAAKKWKEEGIDRVFDAFVDAGGNVLDTARVYTTIANSEPTIGKWFRHSNKRDQIILISKGGHPNLFPIPNMHKFRLSPKEMIKDLDASLKDLGTDYLDIYLYHRDDPKRPVEELVETMESFVKSGKIRYYGVSNWTLPRIIEAQEYCKQKGYRGFVMNQSLLNVATEYSLPPRDDTLVKIDRPMQDYHKEIAGTDHDILAAGYMANCGGFFHQYLSGGEKAVRDKTYLTEDTIRIAEEIRRKTLENGTSITQEVLSFYKTLDFPCMALFGPRNTAGMLEAMQALRD